MATAGFFVALLLRVRVTSLLPRDTSFSSLGARLVADLAFLPASASNPALPLCREEEEEKEEEEKEEEEKEVVVVVGAVADVLVAQIQYGKSHINSPVFKTFKAKMGSVSRTCLKSSEISVMTIVDFSLISSSLSETFCLKNFLNGWSAISLDLCSL